MRVKSGVVPLLHNIWSLCSVNKPLLRDTLKVLIVLTAHCSEGMSKLSNVTRLLQGCHRVVTTLLMAVNVVHACMTYVCMYIHVSRSALGEISHYNMVSQCNYSRLHLIYPPIIETVKDWADCEQLTPIEVGQIFVKILPTSIGVNCSQSAQSLTVSIMGGYIK